MSKDHRALLIPTIIYILVLSQVGTKQVSRSVILYFCNIFKLGTLNIQSDFFGTNILWTKNIWQKALWYWQKFSENVQKVVEGHSKKNSVKTKIE